MVSSCGKSDCRGCSELDMLNPNLAAMCRLLKIWLEKRKDGAIGRFDVSYRPMK
jgi:hypothetical protein